MDADADAAAEAEPEIAEIQALRKRIQALGDDSRRVNGRLYVRWRHRPLIVLGAALAAGFVLGRLIRRATATRLEAVALD